VLLLLGERLEIRAPGAIGPLRMRRDARSALLGLCAEGEAASQREAARRLHEDVSAHPRASVEDHMRRARFLLGAEGDSTLAVRAAESACTLHSPPPLEALELLARALLGDGRPAEAMTVLEGLEGHPGVSPEAVAELRSSSRRMLAENLAHGASPRVLEEVGR
jgi:hypothetical protein